MEKKTNKGLIAAGIAIGVVACILIGVLIGMFILRGGNGSEELVTDAFCELNKSSGEDYYYRIPKLNIDKPWAEEVNEKMYNTLYDEYQKGTVLYDGENPASAEMGYEWTEKDSVISIVVQIKSNVTGGYEFFTFNIDTGKEREITDEELIEIFGYEKTEYFDRIRESVRGIYDSEVSEIPSDSGNYESFLEDAQSDEVLENIQSFINSDGALNVITPVFSADTEKNELTIVDIETGTVKDYFEFKGNYTEIKPDTDMSANGNSDGTINGRLEITDAEAEELAESILQDADLITFDNTTETTGKVIVTLISDVRGGGSYLRYFDDEILGGEDNSWADRWSAEPDPLCIFNYGYVKMTEKNVKWICENIYNVTYNPDFSDDTIGYDGNIQAYADGGYVYRHKISNSGGGAAEMEVGAKLRLDDGRYKIALSGFSSYRQDQGEFYWLYVVDKREIDGERYMTYYESRELSRDEFDSIVAAAEVPNVEVERLKISDEDIRELKETIIDKYLLPDFDYKTTKTGSLIRMIIGSGSISVYEKYFDDYIHYITPAVGKNAVPWVPDPREHAMSRQQYIVVPEENLKWICENIFHVEYNYDFEKEPATDYAYVEYAAYSENGKIYRETQSMSLEPEITSVVRSSELADGRYEIIFKYEGNDFGKSNNPYIAVCVDVQMIEGERQFTFYNIARMSRDEVETGN